MDSPHGVCFHVVAQIQIQSSPGILTPRNGPVLSSGIIIFMIIYEWIWLTNDGKMLIFYLYSAVRDAVRALGIRHGALF